MDSPHAARRSGQPSRLPLSRRVLLFVSFSPSRVGPLCDGGYVRPLRWPHPIPCSSSPLVKPYVGFSPVRLTDDLPCPPISDRYRRYTGWTPLGVPSALAHPAFPPPGSPPVGDCLALAGQSVRMEHGLFTHVHSIASARLAPHSCILLHLPTRSKHGLTLGAGFAVLHVITSGPLRLPLCPSRRSGRFHPT